VARFHVFSKSVELIPAMWLDSMCSVRMLN